MTEDDEMNDSANTDEDFVSGSAGGRAFDDDRLLAYALGLGDDPELEAAAREDDALRDRIAAMRGDVDAVAAGLDRVVPAPPDDYADLGEARWGELRESVTAPAAPRRRPAWLRVLAPAAAIALVLVAGVVGLQRLGDGEGNEAATTSADDKAVESYDRQKTSAGQGEAGPTTDGLAAPTPAAAAADPGYETVVVAVAAPPAAGRQDFYVRRVVFGEAGPLITLEIDEQALVAHALAILYLTPTGDETGASAPPKPTVSASPPPSVASKALRFTFDGAPAWARQLAPGIDPERVTLP